MKPIVEMFERRYIPADDLRAETVDGKLRMIGHAAVFNTLSEDLGGFREQVAPGTFAETLKVDDVRALWNHNPDYVLGRNMKSKTLKLSEDERGLLMDVEPPDTQWARDLHVTISRRDVTQQSFGFRTVRDRWETRAGKNFRTLLEVKLFDVSPVTFPAYTSTDVSARKLALECAGADSEAVLAAVVRAERKLQACDGDDELLRVAGEEVRALEARRVWTPNAAMTIAQLRLRLEASLVS